MKITNWFWVFCFSFNVLAFANAAAGASAATASASASSVGVSDKTSADGFLIGMASTWRTEHSSTGENIFRNYPSLELGYLFSSHTIGLAYGRYEANSGNESMNTKRETSSTLLYFSETLFSNRYHSFEGALGIGAYQDVVTSRLLNETAKDVSEWQSMAQMAAKYFFKFNSTFSTGPSVALSFAKNFDPNPVFDLNWNFRAKF